jgi:hypothetical protein
MLASLTLVALLQAPTAGADALALANPRFTYGLLGPARTDAKVRPGDSLLLSFDIQGISTDETGKASYSTLVEVADAKGKALFSQPSRKFQEFLPLGGGTVPAFAHIDLGPDAPAGTYTMKVTVTDAATMKSASAAKEVEVIARGFDVVRLALTGDADGLVPVGAYCVGQPLWVHGAVVGFERGKEAMAQPKVNLTLRVLDEAGKPIVAKPFSGAIEKDVPANTTALPLRFFVPLNKAGTYTVELTATDALKKGATATKKFPLVVLPHK